MGGHKSKTEKINPYKALLATFRHKVEDAMSEQGVSPSKLAKDAKIAPKTVNNMLRGRRSPSLKEIYQVAAALNIEFGSLWTSRPDQPERSSVIDAKEWTDIKSKLKKLKARIGALPRGS